MCGRKERQCLRHVSTLPFVLMCPLTTRLQEKKALEWRDQVEILFGDMRELDVPAHADILVSELLGSFGDNELSPECLDGAMRFLKRTFAPCAKGSEADKQQPVYPSRRHIPHISPPSRHPLYMLL